VAAVDRGRLGRTHRRSDARLCGRFSIVPASRRIGRARDGACYTGLPYRPCAARMSATSSPSPDRSAAERDYLRAREHLAANDLDGAAQWLERAAENAHPAALTELAILHLHGFGRAADPARAVELLQHAERVGGTAEASYLLAQIALGGIA